MTDTTHETGNPGRVQETHGPIVTIQFAPKAVPPLFSRLTANSNEILCVVQHLSAGRVRAVAIRPKAIWTPGQEIIDTGEPFTQPLDTAIIQQSIDTLITSAKNNEQANAVQTLNAKRQTPVPLPSGIKNIEVFAPLIQGGSTGIFTEWGLGVLVLLPELLRHLDREENRQTFFVFMPPIRDASHWQEVTTEITLGTRNIAIIYLPVADPISPEFVDRVQNLDTILVLSRRLAELAIWPCVDPLLSRSPRLNGIASASERTTVGAETRRLLTRYFTLQFSSGEEARHTLSLQECLEVQRARKALRFLSQPFYVAEPYTGRPGVSVTFEEALRGFADIVAGRYDTTPRDAFYMIGAAPIT